MWLALAASGGRGRGGGAGDLRGDRPARPGPAQHGRLPGPGPRQTWSRPADHVAAIVGRDTESLDEAGVVRAAVESVAESTVDGVTAPLLFAVLAGPVGAIVYRAINTLDSMFGHRTTRYRDFGWAAARIDDLANYLPARLTAPLVCLAAALLGQRPLAARARCSSATAANMPAPTPAWPRPPWPGPWACNWAAATSTTACRWTGPPSAIPACRWPPATSATANALMFATAALLLAPDPAAATTGGGVSWATTGAAEQASTR